MELEQHERIVLQMLKEIKARGRFVSGKVQHTEFLKKNGLIKRITLTSAGGSAIGKTRYRLMPHGEGMLQHLINKYEKELPDAEPRNEHGPGNQNGA